MTEPEQPNEGKEGQEEERDDELVRSLLKRSLATDVVAKETAKQIPSESFRSKGYSHRATRRSSRDALTRCRRPRAVASPLILFA